MKNTEKCTGSPQTQDYIQSSATASSTVMEIEKKPSNTIINLSSQIAQQELFEFKYHNLIT